MRNSKLVGAQLSKLKFNSGSIVLGSRQLIRSDSTVFPRPAALRPMHQNLNAKQSVEKIAGVSRQHYDKHSKPFQYGRR